MKNLNDGNPSRASAGNLVQQLPPRLARIDVEAVVDDAAALGLVEASPQPLREHEAPARLDLHLVDERRDAAERGRDRPARERVVVRVLVPLGADVDVAVDRARENELSRRVDLAPPVQAVADLGRSGPRDPRRRRRRRRRRRGALRWTTRSKGPPRRATGDAQASARVDRHRPLHRVRDRRQRERVLDELLELRALGAALELDDDLDPPEAGAPWLDAVGGGEIDDAADLDLERVDLDAAGGGAPGEPDDEALARPRSAACPRATVPCPSRQLGRLVAADDVAPARSVSVR